MSKDRSIWQLFVLCLPALGDIVPKCFFSTIVWDTPGKEKVAKWSSAPASILEGLLNQLHTRSKNLSKLGWKHNFAKSTRAYPPPWALEIGTICPFGVFSLFYSNFGPNLRPMHVARPIVVLTRPLSLRAFQGWFWVLKPQIHHLSFSGPKMAFSSSQNTTF